MVRMLMALIGLMWCLLLGAMTGVEAQKRPVRIAELTESWGPTPYLVGVRDGLVELGYRENEDFVVGVRFTQGDLGALDLAAQQLVGHGVDVIVASGANAANAAQRATAKIPIVFGGLVGDPVALGLVRSIANPGGNLTGVTDLDLELGPKRLELFRELVPRLKRVLFPYSATDPYTAAGIMRYREAARRLEIALVEKPVGTAAEARDVLAAVPKHGVDGILAPSALALNIPGLILEAAKRYQTPTMFSGTFWPEQGALAGYGQDFYDSGRQAARLMDKILRGADPGSIPVEANQKIEFALNLKTAAAIGLQIPPHVLLRASRLFK